ncbi:MAG: trypsin-like peptidase domain-containing protein [Planctomycetales bacterium]|nr:trypsin-like peptidase domain-containing protein [Planctomycetales bacterium]
MRRALAVVAALGALPAAAQDPAPVPAPQADDAFQARVVRAQARVLPSLVFIRASQVYFDQGVRAAEEIVGSGILVSPSGEVLTNNHVAERSERILCVFSDRTECPAKVVGLDPETDLALLRLDRPAGAPPLPVAAFGDSSKLRVGDFVMALGAPLGLSRSLSMGVISALDRELPESPFTLWLQTDAAINPGNSGGPLVNVEGEVVGVNTLKDFGGEAVGFSLPSETVRPVLEELRRGGKVRRSYLGLLLQPLRDVARSPRYAGASGVLVGGVGAGSPAEAAGFRAGDLLLAVAGAPVSAREPHELPAVRRAIAALAPGRAADLAVRRGAETLRLSATPLPRDDPEGEPEQAPAFELTVAAITRLSPDWITLYARTGALVKGVREGGPASRAGVAPDDIVVSLDGQPIPDLAAFREAYRRAASRPEGERAALLQVLRRGLTRYLPIEYHDGNDTDAGK